MFFIFIPSHRDKKGKRFVANLLVCALLLGSVFSCAAAEAVEYKNAVQCEVSNTGFKEVKPNQQVQVITDTKTGATYYSAEDLEDIFGFSYHLGNSETIYNHILGTGAPCVLMQYQDMTYELFATEFYRTVGGAMIENPKPGVTHITDNGEVFLSEPILSRIFNVFIQKDGTLLCLSDNGKSFPGCHGLKDGPREAIKDAMWMLYARDREGYDRVMECHPSFISVTEQRIREMVGWSAGAFVYFDSPIMYIRQDVFNSQTENLAALIVHESTHWYVGNQGSFNTETLPTERQILCLIRLGVDLDVVQSTIKSIGTRTAYQNGAARGQEVLNNELRRREGEKAAENFILPLNEKVYSLVGKALSQK